MNKLSPFKMNRLFVFLLGECCECLCSDFAPIHLTESLSSGSEGSSTEHLSDQSDVNRSQQGGLCKCSSKHEEVKTLFQ